jgi:ribosomal-protein-alanine N-acetyltransferase
VSDPTLLARTSWRAALPNLVGTRVTLREPEAGDVAAILGILGASDATHFGVDEPINDLVVQQFVERAAADRVAGRGFTYVVVGNESRALVGVLQVRQLDPAFQAGEWECTLAPAVRGTGVFLEVARLAGSLAFGTIGVHRLEARVLLQNGRANGALRKLGAVQEGILRRACRRKGEYLDQVLWSVLRDDWGEHWVATADRVH